MSLPFVPASGPTLAPISAPAPEADPAGNIRAQTPIAIAKAIAMAYQLRGLSPNDALAAAQIAPSMLETSTGFITSLQMEVLSACAMRELDDEALGWFSRRLPWGSYGMLVRASMGASTIGLAMRRWCRHHGLLTDDIALAVRVSDGVARLELTEQRDLGALRELCVVSVLRNALGVACWLADSRIPLLHTTLRYAPPAHHKSYRILFDGPCSFNANANCISFDAGYLALPLRRDEAALQRMLQRALLLTVRPYRRDRLLIERVRQALQAFPQLSHNADSLAVHLNLSARTLHRQLKEEGSSLQQIKDQVRRDLACDQLLRSARAIKQIAEAVGFRSEKSFIRAFKAWTGTTPDAYRRN